MLCTQHARVAGTRRSLYIVRFEHAHFFKKIMKLLASYILNYKLSLPSFLLKFKWVAICIAVTRRISFGHITIRDAFETQHIFGSNITQVPFFNHSSTSSHCNSADIGVPSTKAWWAKSISVWETNWSLSALQNLYIPYITKVISFYREIFLIWARVFLNILIYFLEVMYYSLVARWTDRKHVTYNQS